MPGCWPHSALHVLLTDFGPGLCLSSYTCKNELGQYPAILALHFVNNPLYWLSLVFTLSSVRAELLILHNDCHSVLSCPVSELKYLFPILIFIQFYLFQCKNWNNFPYRLSISFILSSVWSEIAILHTDYRFYLVRCLRWNSNAPYWLSFSFILSTV